MQIYYDEIEAKKNLTNFASFYKRGSLYMVSSVQKRINAGILPANSALTTAVKQGNKTLRDSGRLLASITARNTSDMGAVGTNHIAAKINQFGGTIKAKKRWLLIPASKETRKMQRKYGFRPKDCMAGMESAGYTIRWVASKGKGMVVTATTKGKRKTFVLFIAKRSVKIPARPFLKIDRSDRDVLAEMLRRSVHGK